MEIVERNRKKVVKVVKIYDKKRLAAPIRNMAGTLADRWSVENSIITRINKQRG